MNQKTFTLENIMSLSKIVVQELQIRTETDKWEELNSSAVSTTGSVFATALAEKLKQREQKVAEDTAEHAIELITKSQDKREALVANARELRKRAKELIEQAEELYNSEQHLMLKGKIAPLAICLGEVMINSVDRKVLMSTVDNYYQQKKQQSQQKATD